MGTVQIIEIVLSTITFFLNVYLGLFVLLQNPKSWTNRLFFALTSFINGYVVTNYISLHPPSIESQLLWIRIVMAEASYLGPILVLLVHTFPKRNITMNKFLVGGIFLYATITFILCLSPFVFSSIDYPEGKPIPTPGPAIPVFFFDFGGLFLASFIVLFLKFRKAVGIERVQHLYFLVGIILTFTSLTVFTTIFVVILKNSDLVFLGPIFSLFLVAFLALSIIKHRFMDFRLVVARAVAYAFLVVSLGIIYASGFFIVSTYILPRQTDTSSIITSTLLALFIAYTYQPILRFLERITDRIFYKDQYNSTLLLSRLSKIVSSSLQLEHMIETSFKELVSKIKVTHCSIVLLKDHKITWIKTLGEQIDSSLQVDELEYLNQLCTNNGQRNERILVYEELNDVQGKEILRRYRALLFVPLYVKGEMVGVMMFGEKSSGEVYSSTDIEVLKIFAPEMAIAVKNALAYEEIKNFNITLQSEVEKATSNLKMANEQLKELDKIKDEFVYMASHELRTPMTAIKNYLWLALNKHKDKLDESLTTELTRAYISTERLIRLVQDMLTVSRIEGNRLVFDVKPVKLEEAARQIVDELSGAAKEKNLALTFVPPSESFVVRADQSRIMEVLQNFIGNSLKFTPSGGSITVSIRRNNGSIETSVSDTGVGIPQEDMPRLFQKFGRLGHSYKRFVGETGTGLGLFITKQIVESHGGKISVTSEVDHGSTFTFSLPEYKEATV